MTGNLLRRIEAMEVRAKGLRRRVTMTPEIWLKIAAIQSRILLDTFPADAPDLFDRLYLAIAAGNADGDAASPYRASLKRRFDWAVYDATRKRLGPSNAGRWHKVKIEAPDRDDWFDYFLAELPERHPELIGPPPPGATAYLDVRGWNDGDPSPERPSLAFGIGAYPCPQ